MKRRWKILLGLCGVIAVGAVCFFCFRENEPSYNGRTLSEWIAIYGNERKPAAQRESARAAIEAMGTEAVPCLLRWMKYYPSDFSLWVWRKLPIGVSLMPQVANMLANQGPRAERAENAYRAFGALGSAAEPAIDELAKRAAHSNDDIPSLRALLALGIIGPPAHRAFLECVSTVDTNLNGPEILAVLAKDVRHAMPVLVEELNSPDAKVRASATNVIERFVPELRSRASISK